MGKSGKKSSVKNNKAEKVIQTNIKKKNKTEKKSIVNDAKILKAQVQIKETPQNETKSVENKIKYKMPSKSITDDLVNSCLSVLLKLNTQHKKKNTLLDDEVPIFAEIRCIKIQNLPGNVRFILPHSTVASTGEVCLITPDLKKGAKSDHEATIDHWEEKLRKAGVTNVKTILPLRQLRVEYDQFELKRRLLTQHDFILVDTRVLNHTSHVMGKMFFRKHNMLVPVRIDEAKLKNSIENGLKTATLRLNVGETSVIMVGHTGMPQDKVKENVVSLVDQLRTKYPGGEANIRIISLKLPLSLSLPLYLTLRSSNTVHAPKLKHKRPKNADVEDELSTKPGNKVRVAPDGTVKLIKLDDDNSEPEESENDAEGEIESEKEADDDGDE